MSRRDTIAGWSATSHTFLCTSWARSNTRASLTGICPMRMLVIGGTGFVGSHVVRALAAASHEVAVFHRGETATQLSDSVSQIRGDRTRLQDYARELRALEPHIVIDLAAYTEADANGLVSAFKGIA